MLCDYFNYYQQAVSYMSFIHAVEELLIWLQSSNYMAKEDIGTLKAVVTATRVADFRYTVSVVTKDGSAVGKQLRWKYSICIDMQSR